MFAMCPQTYMHATQAPPSPRQFSTHGTSCAFPTPRSPDEDWTKIDDLAERRRIQNRIAQRNYRKKLKKRLEELERRAGSTNGESVGEKETSCTRRKGADGTRYKPCQETTSREVSDENFFCPVYSPPRYSAYIPISSTAAYWNPYTAGLSKLLSLQGPIVKDHHANSEQHLLRYRGCIPEHRSFGEGSASRQRNRHRDAPPSMRACPSWNNMGILALTAAFCSGAIIPVAVAQQHGVPNPVLHFALGTSIVASGAIPPLRGSDSISSNYWLAACGTWGAAFTTLFALEILRRPNGLQRRLMWCMVLFTALNLLGTLSQNADSTIDGILDWGALALTASLCVVPVLMDYMSPRAAAEMAGNAVELFALH